MVKTHALIESISANLGVFPNRITPTDIFSQPLMQLKETSRSKISLSA